MNPVLTAAVVIAGIGILAALILAFASKYMHVPVDETFTKVREALPGANCGACGYAGCDGYAEALSSKKDAATNKCVPGGNDVSRELSSIMGTAFEETERVVAFVSCNGTSEATKKKAELFGHSTCKGATLLFGGDGECRFGCLGYGDCVAACPEHAIRIEDGIAKIDPERCIGDGLCARVCPKKLIVLIPKDAPVKIPCKNEDKGAVTRKICTSGCIGCGLCQKKCPEGAITVLHNVARIDYTKCVGCMTCLESCPTKCIV